MKFLDMIILGFDNLWRTKLRTSLTTLGVIIGIGALTSMVSFGTGLQKNITDAIGANDLFTSLFITSKKLELHGVDPTDPDDVVSMIKKPSVPLTDSTVQAIQQIEGVAVVFPEISFPVKIRFGTHDTRSSVRALTVTMGAYKPFSEITYGTFFQHDSARQVVLNWDALKKMKLLVQDSKKPEQLSKEDSLQGIVAITPDSIIGKKIQIISAALDVSQLPANPLLSLLSPSNAPLKESVSEFTVCGILKRVTPFPDRNFDAGALIPIKSAQTIPRLGFSSVWDFLGGAGKQDGYASIYVRANSIAEIKHVREQLEKMGLNIFTIADQLKSIQRSFMIFDAVLGAIGTIALVVAALGIVNTMVMSILERTREIGIMKAIGGSENEIKMIFFVEAGTIGVIGALFGLLLGWSVTRAANFVANSQFLPIGEAPVDFFYFPVWLILGAIIFSVLISLAAGLYPAIRAARVDPVKALRHD